MSTEEPLATAIAEFLETRRIALVARWEVKVRGRLASDDMLTSDQLRDSMHLFLDELIEALRHGGNQLAAALHSPIARDHGGQRQLLDRDIAELVREYSLLHQAIIEEAAERGEPLEPNGLCLLTTFLFAGAAEAVEVYAGQQERARRHSDFEYFAFVAHELRNPLSSARMGWELVKRRGDPRAPFGAVIDRSLARLSELIDHSIVHARMQGVVSLSRERLSVDGLIEEAQADALIEAEAKQVTIVTTPVGLTVAGDHRLVRSALTNLVRNAVKFTAPGGTVAVRGRSDEDQAIIEIEDECGGLSPQGAERLFRAFQQERADRSGFGLGLAISKQAIEAHGGTLSVKNIPGKGCIFTMILP